MKNIKWNELIAISQTLNQLNEVIAVDKGDYYQLYYKDFISDVGKIGNDFILNYLPIVNKPLNFFPPFKSKILPDGKKLFRRKHGKKETILANSSNQIIFTVPYGQAKINKLEIIDANPLDRIDMYVKSPLDASTAAAYGMPPDFLLNQFGFDVIVSELLYSDKSDYDADVFAGFQIVVVYKNDTDSDKEVGFNLIYHEVK